MPDSRDRAEIVDELLPAHADAGVGDGDGLRLLVGRDGDLERGIAAQKLRVSDGFVA